MRTGKDDIAAARKRAANRNPGVPPHNDRVSRGGFFKKAQIGRDMPRHFPIQADHSVMRPGDDQSKSSHENLFFKRSNSFNNSGFTYRF